MPSTKIRPRPQKSLTCAELVVSYPRPPVLRSSPFLEKKGTIKNFSVDGFITRLQERIPEEEEVIQGKEGELYSRRIDDRSLNYSMVAFDILERTHVEGNHKILEVACGAGQLAHFLYLFSKNKNIIATDGGKELIASCRRKYQKEPVRFFVKNVHSHPWKNSRDVVVCKDSFHHFKDPVQGMKELLDLVAPQGTLYIYDLTRDAPYQQIAARLTTFVNDHEKKRFLQSLNASWTLEEMTRVLETLGMKDWQYFSPRDFSEKNLACHRKWIEIDRTQEHTFSRLSRIYLVKKTIK
jgi:SAM-dependent methyltransferase